MGTLGNQRSSPLGKTNVNVVLWWTRTKKEKRPTNRCKKGKNLNKRDKKNSPQNPDRPVERKQKTVSNKGEDQRKPWIKHSWPPEKEGREVVGGWVGVTKGKGQKGGFFNQSRTAGVL